MGFILRVHKPTQEELLVELEAIHAELTRIYTGRPFTAEVNREITDAVKQRLGRVLRVYVYFSQGSPC